MAVTPAELARRRAEAGLPVDATALSSRARRALRLADELGAPRGPVLAAVASGEAAALALRREVEVAAAGPRAVARGLVLLPPLVGPATALLVTDDPFAVWTTPLGHLLGAAAVACWLGGLVVVRLLVRRAAAAPSAPRHGAAADEVLDLLATAVAAGSAPSAAARRVGRVTGDDAPVRLALWLELGGATTPPDGWEDVGPSLIAAVRDGLPLVPLLRGLAAGVRRAEQHVALRRVARLEARLTLPTTLLLLPAAGLVVAAPLVHGLLGALDAA